MGKFWREWGSLILVVGVPAVALFAFPHDSQIGWRALLCFPAWALTIVQSLRRR